MNEERLGTQGKESEGLSLGEAKLEIEIVDSFALFPELSLRAPFAVRRRRVDDVELPRWFKGHAHLFTRYEIATVGQLLTRHDDSFDPRDGGVLKSNAIIYLREFEPQIFRKIQYTNKLLPELDLPPSLLQEIGPEPVGWLSIPPRVCNPLGSWGYMLIGQVLGQAEESLLKTRLLGIKSLAIIKNAAREYAKKRQDEVSKAKIIPISEEAQVATRDEMVELYPGINLPFSELPRVLRQIAEILEERTDRGIV